MSSITRGRQRPGPACDECRRRKLRCDGQQPQCGTCQETDIVCEVTPRGTRGPKKGHLKALKSRVEELEAMLESSLSAQEPDDLQIQNQNNAQSSSEGTVAASPVNVTRPVALNITEPWQPTATSSVPELGAFSFLPDSPSLSHGLSSSTLSINICLPPTDIVRAEL